MKNLLTSILCMVALLSVSVVAHSAKITRCTHNGNTKTLKQRVPISRGTFPVDFVYRVDPRYEKAFQRAANALNGSPARLRVNRLKADRIGLYSPGTFYGNKQNDVFLAIGTRGNYKWAAKTKLRVDCKQGALTEADIELNIYASIEAEGRIIYGYDDDTFNEVNLAWSGFGPGINWPSVLIHELGHAFGLSHTPDTASNMGYDNPHHYPGLADVVQYYVGEDMADGLVHLYWTKVNKMEDVGISRHVYGFIWGGYARVEMVRVYPYDDNEPYSPYYDDDQRLGTKIPIDTRKIKLAAGLENNGKKKRHENVKVEYYFSTNSVISKSDRLLKTKYFNLSRDRVYYPSEALDISFLADEIRSGQRRPGRNYYIGVMIDADNQISETRLGNNTAAFPFNM